MAKGIWIARVDVADAEKYPEYVKTAAPAFKRYKAKFLARGGEVHLIEGSARTRNVVIEFATLQDALDCYNSPEYQAALKIRQSVSEGELIIMEGTE
jgi:uncharacterized protein (DUF1330 family)